MGTERMAKIVCFAYGSNMLSDRMRASDRVPSAKPLRIGYITRHRLTFDKVSEDESGKCDAEATEDEKDRVYGVLYEVAKAEKPKLDEAEGLGHGYDEKSVQVITAKGTRPAVMYYATKKDLSRKPYHWYKAFVVAGAVEHELPFSYIEWLRTAESMQDAKMSRRLCNERLLSKRQLTTRSTQTRAKVARAGYRGR